MNIHAKGNKLKLLFKSNKGTASMQDLYDMSVSSLRDMANELNRGLKKSDDLFAVKTQKDSDNRLRLDIILDVLENREVENTAKISAEENKQKLEKVRKRIQAKKEEAEDELSLEELEAIEKELTSK